MTSSKRILMTGVVLGLVTLSATSRHRVAVPTSNPAVVINVDAAANRHAIDPRIYGSAYASTAQLIDLGITINRWGGNLTSTHNWSVSTANHCKDFYFENISGDSADDFVNQTNAGGAQPLITIPLLSWLPKSASFNCGFRISKYGPQDGFDGYSGNTDCGSGKLNGNRLLHVNDPADTSAMYTSAHQADWVQHLVSTFGSASEGGVRYYGLDNEPVLWSYDHWDVHPDGSTYDEVWSKWQDYGPAIKARDSGALLTGPEEWGWSGYFDSGIDAENNNSADRIAHGNVPLAAWLLQQSATYEAANHIRIVDFFTLHFYPQGDADGNQEFSDDDSTPTQLLRNRSTRSLWDPNYVNESWIGARESTAASSS